MAKEVCTWGSDWQFAGFDQSSGVGVFGGSDSDVASLSGDDCREDIEIGFEDDGEGSWPVSFGQELEQYCLFLVHFD